MGSSLQGTSGEISAVTNPDVERPKNNWDLLSPCNCASGVAVTKQVEVDPHIALFQLLDDSDPIVRHSAVRSISNIGVSASRLAPALAHLLKDESEDIRVAAADELSKLGKYAAPYISRISDNLCDVNPNVRVATALALGNLGRYSVTSRAGLFGCLSDECPAVRLAALRALSSLRRCSPQQLCLSDLLEDDDRSVRLEAALEATRELAELGSSSDMLLPILADSIRHGTDIERQKAFDAMSLCMKYAAPSLITVAQLLRYKNEHCMKAGVNLLATLGSLGAPFVPELEELLRDPNPRVRKAAATAVGALGETASSCVPALIDLLHDGDEGPRAAAARSLGKFDKHASLFLESLTLLTNDENSDVRVASCQALHNLDSSALASVSTCADSRSAFTDDHPPGTLCMFSI